MARPRQFDEEHVVDAAMHAFWVTGYQATTTDDLCQVTGLGRSSIYNAFSCKRELFKRALEHYTETVSRQQTAALDGTELVRDKVRTLFDAVIEDEFDRQRRGCLAVNTSVELARRDPSITAALQRHSARLHEALRWTIENGQRNGEIAPDRDPQALARFIQATIAGMRVLAAGGAAREQVSEIASVALDSL